MSQFYQAIVQALSEEQPFALAILAGVKGSSPQKKGAKALFFADGRIIGTMGGGCLEAEIQDRARRALLSGTPTTFDLLLDHDFGWDDGLICGGSVQGLILPHAPGAAGIWRVLAETTQPRRWGVRKDFSIDWAEAGATERADTGEWLYLETVSPPCALWVAGSGHIAQAVAPLAAQLEFEVTVFDDRPALTHRGCFPAPIRLRVAAWEQLLEEPLPKPPVFGLIVTRGHQHDARVLARWIALPFACLGMIGSRRKAQMMREQFLVEGLATPEQWARLHCPVGLPILAQGVQEIAISIMAQYIQERALLNIPSA